MRESPIPLLISSVLVFAKFALTVTIDATEVNLETRIVHLERELSETKETLAKLLETVNRISLIDNDKENDAVINDDKNFCDKVAKALMSIENKFDTFKGDITVQVEKQVINVKFISIKLQIIMHFIVFIRVQVNKDVRKITKRLDNLTESFKSCDNAVSEREFSIFRLDVMQDLSRVKVG